MHLNPVMVRIGGAWHREVDHATCLAANAPECRGCVVACHRPLAAGQHRGHPLTLVRESSPPYGVDAAVDGMQPSGCNPVLNGLNRVSEREELREGNHAVLER